VATVVGALRQTRVVLAGQLGGWIFYAVGILAFLVFVLPRLFQNPSLFIQTVVFGVTDGAIYALTALGYTMVYGIIELINFAHGDIFTLGGFLGILFFGLLGFAPNQGSNLGLLLLPILVFVMATTMLVNGFINMAIERIAYKPLRHAPRLAPLITAVGMSFLIEGVMFLWKGPNQIQSPDLLPAKQVIIMGAAVDTREGIVIGVTIVLLIGLVLFIERTRLGKAMRATAQDRDAALLMGIDIDQTIAATFFIGAILAGAGGTMYGLYYNTSVFDLGFSAGLVAFTAAVFGGIGNIYGAAIGGLVIGMIQSFWDGYFDSAWTQVIIFAILILILVFRPTGILGMRVPEK
jgi:branched-chain amino acid transport system permease protein